AVMGYNLLINDLAAYNISALQLATDDKVLSAEYVRSANEAIGTSEVIEYNQKQVTDIYLNTIGKDVDDFTSSQASELLNIANQCPMVGGNAVYRARSLYSLIDDEVDFDDQLLCLQAGIIVKSLMDNASLNLQLVPNPARDAAALMIS